MRADVQSIPVNFPKNLAFGTIPAYTYPIGTHGRRKRWGGKPEAELPFALKGSSWDTHRLDSRRADRVMLSERFFVIALRVAQVSAGQVSSFQFRLGQIRAAQVGVV